MCESNAYLEEAEGETMLMENVGHLVLEGDAVVLEGILGDRVRVEKGSIKEINFLDHRIVLTKTG